MLAAIRIHGPQYIAPILEIIFCVGGRDRGALDLTANIWGDPFEREAHGHLISLYCIPVCCFEHNCKDNQTVASYIIMHEVFFLQGRSANSAT